MANTYAAALVVDRLSESAITVLGNKLAPLRAFSRDFGTDLLRPRATVQVQSTATTSTAAANPSDYESGDSTSTAVAVSRVLAEKAAGRTKNGSVDLIWINGENFSKMKENGLLFGPFTENLPNFKLVDFIGKPTTLIDFHMPVVGYEAPWGMAKFNFVFDSARVSETPKSIPELLQWSKRHPGRFTYPHVTDFLGSTFLMQALIELTENPEVLNSSVKSKAAFSKVTAPLWNYLNQLHPLLWRSGKSFPASISVQQQMLNDSELDIALSFNPSDTSAAIANGSLPESARTFVLKKGTIGNTHFVAIPFNSGSSQGAMIVANFLMSPEAQM